MHGQKKWNNKPERIARKIERIQHGQMKNKLDEHYLGQYDDEENDSKQRLAIQMYRIYSM